MSAQYRKKEWLISKYESEGWSQNEIAEYCGVTQGTIYKWMRRFNIPSRDMSESHLGTRNGAWIESPIKDYQNMYREYVLNKKTLRDIAKENSASLRTVARWLKEHNIDTRVGADAIMKPRDGENNANWKGGSFCPNCARPKGHASNKCQLCYFEFLRNNPTEHPNYSGKCEITAILRSYSRSNWSTKVFERDTYTCRECGDSSGGNLNAHHIVPFVTIRDQIILENSYLNLELESDRLEVIDIAKSDRRINDIDNGITLCKSCHIGEHQRIKLDLDELVYVYRATVIDVLDPDTLLVDMDLGLNITIRESIRLYGINAPETTSTDPNKETALRGKSVMQALCMPGRELLLRTYKSGKYGRWLAIVILDSSFINHALTKHGLAEEEYYV